MNLVIVAGLSEYPSESLSFRYLTLVAHDQLNLDCLIETSQEMKDMYYYYLLHRGLLDYVEQLIVENEEDGIRLDDKHDYPKTVCVPAIKFDNIFNILGQVKSLSRL